VDIGRIYQLDIVTLRVFDVLACGGFLLAHHNDDVVRLFEPGVELDTWRTIDELQSKITRYLPEPELRRRIGEAGRARVLRDHTVRQRLAELLG
jgi:spore maturation protein CgeB